MITVLRSDTGSYVLVHEPTQSVMVGDELEATFVRMEEHLRAGPLLGTSVPVPPSVASMRPNGWLIGVGVLALLPFLWLGTLHYTLGRLVDELRTTSADVPSDADDPALRADLEALEQVVARIEDEVGRSRRGEAAGWPPPRERGSDAGPAGGDTHSGSPDTGVDSAETDAP